MAKKQTRRSISVSRTTYERLKAFCETNNISMSQFVETRVGDFLGEGASATVVVPAQPRPTPAPMTPMPAKPAPIKPAPAPAPIAKPIGASVERPAPVASVAPAPVVPMTSAAARYAIEPPPPIIKPKAQDTNAPKPAEKRADHIFTF